MTREKRQSVRHVLKDEVIMCKVLPDIEGRLLNICSNGACVGSDEKLAVGGRKEIRLENRGQTVNLKGVVIWEITDGSDDNIKHQAGLKFVDMSDEERSLLERFLAVIVQ